MEIEAKYAVSGDDLEALASVRQLGRYTVTPAPAPELQENIYYDTTDARLSAARYGLRVRRTGDHALITLKGPSEVGQEGVHRRAEFEFPGADPDPQTWPDGVARDLALALTRGEPLLPRVLIRTERRVLHVTRDGAPIAELCLDRGIMRSGARERSFTEVEIELREAGTAADLSDLARELASRVTLTPEPRSKLERALAL
ncbi:MAG: CYTH domain-containing protein [Oscillochloridaceae bacterium]|nr:CYTH domain-containing protein [Chloroflexaceae bacterium]MDW8390344.1 CYTH domain-containing protein [Oscillochloridaceae bacterium]